MEINLQELAWIATIFSVFGGLAIVIFKQIVIVPVQKSITSLAKTIDELKDSINRQLEIMDREIDILKEKTTRQEEQIKTLFNRTGGEG